MCSLCLPSLDRDLRDLKKRRSALIASLKSSTVDGVRPQRTGQTHLRFFFFIFNCCFGHHELMSAHQQDKVLVKTIYLIKLRDQNGVKAG